MLALIVFTFLLLKCGATQVIGNRKNSTDAKSFFTNDRPAGYFSRTNLNDCHSRFSTRSISHLCFIFNGMGVEATEFPHMAVIGWPDAKEKFKWKCGGSLITKKFVLTAAHCAFDENNKAPTVVRLGDVDLISSVDDRYAQQINIVNFTRHPKHIFKFKYNDIALIELEKEVVLTFGVCPACLWYSENFPYDTFDVAGFGDTSYAGQGSPYLLRAFLNPVPKETCIEAFSSTRDLIDGIVEDQLCASNTDMDTCHGDSGGPLQTTLCTFTRNVAFLVGVTAFGQPCGKGSFGVYQKIYPHMEWIRSIVNETLDPLECAKKYESLLSVNYIQPECTAYEPYRSRVELIWQEETTAPKCSGTLIDYNTVLTTASCTLNSEGEEPFKIRILGEAITITNVQRHPEYELGSFQNDIALIRLELYLRKNTIIAPVCLKESTRNFGISSLLIARKVKEAKMHTYLPAVQRCNEQTRSSLNRSELLNENFECWSTDYRMLPGLCEIDQGGPFLDYYHNVMYGINIFAQDCGSYNPLIILKVNHYIDWIEAYVLDRLVIPEPPVAYPEEDKSPLLSTPCTTKAGDQGECLHSLTCREEINKHDVDRIGVTLCGFEDDIEYICCPTRFLEVEDYEDSGD